MKSEFIVADMSCNHCVQTITKAVNKTYPQARVHADLDQHRVAIEGVDDSQALARLIQESGYEVQAA